MRAASLLAVTSLFVSVLGSSNSGGPEVVIQSNDQDIKIHGVTGPKPNVTRYLGIPFAKPPVGDLRLRAPQAIDYSEYAEAGIDASAFGPPCLQPLVTNGSENCLHLNVYTPTVEAVANLKQSDAELHGKGQGFVTDFYKDGLPVLVWIYGGAFGNGGTLLYDPSPLVKLSVSNESPVIVVSINYRVGILGWPGGKEAAAANASMLGLQDQILALQWVQDHISSFGGDPKKVTVYGESAGAISIGLHMLNPEHVAAVNGDSGTEKGSDCQSQGGAWVAVKQPLFRGAILMSGSAQTTPLSSSDKSHQFHYDHLVNLTECANSTQSFECLRNMSGEDLVVAMTTMANDPTLGAPYSPSIDGHYLVGSPQELYAQGRFAQIPTMEGTVLDEGTKFVPLKISSEEEMKEHLARSQLQFAGLVLNETVLNTLSDLYVGKYGAPFRSPKDETFGLSPFYKYIAAINGDVTFIGTRRNNQEQLVKHNNPTWSYQFTQPSNESSPWGVFHGSDLSYTFGAAIDQTSFHEPTSEELVKQIMGYIINFATHLNPNGSPDSPFNEKTKETLNLVDWPMYGPEATQIQWEAGNVTLIRDDYRKDAMSYLQSIPEVLGH